MRSVLLALLPASLQHQGHPFLRIVPEVAPITMSTDVDLKAVVFIPLAQPDSGLLRSHLYLTHTVVLMGLCELVLYTHAVTLRVMFRLVRSTPLASVPTSL